MRPQSYLSNKEQIEEGDIRDAIGADLNQLNVEEITKLKEFLKTINEGASCSIAQQGKRLIFNPFLASKTDRNNMWVLDSEATNNMTPNIHVLDTYEPLEPTKRITIANGTSVPIKGKGKDNFSPQLSINQVLYVLDLTPASYP